ncbi:adenosylcobinamide amidohydrolase [Leptospira sarikeiensis]|uniref:Cobalamin biosynthesis protein n=1 Tax=Leptospira sarikeiensis TaxID=2484943 RepID=A0A4R9K2J9_9LEPT|nr:adenosylcobinamide amidohydrolase [Leptospira sarikeiensis]TGL58426.1 cobalamin biosynthesis protein [Leptospira sarikeiensis]
MNPFVDSPLLTSETWLELQLKEPHDSLSWAVVGGGFLTTNKVYWLKVKNSDLNPDIIPEEFYRNKLSEKGEREEVLGFMTSASLLNYTISEKQFNGWSVRSIATVGLGNAVRIGDPPLPFPKIGTINILVQTSEPLTFSASMEAISIATEARTLAVLESETKNQFGNVNSTGTGTDCIGIISPQRQPAIDYVGKHTIFGHLIGSSVYEAVSQGILNWKETRKGIQADKNI